MNCPICGDRLHPGADRCPGCGYRITNPPAQTDFKPKSRPSGKRRGCCCLFPVILLVLMLLSGAIYVVSSIVTHVYRDNTAPVPEPFSTVPSEATETVPDEEPPTENETRPSAAEGCFAISDGAVTFLPELWDGGPVLQIPDTVDGQTVTALARGCFRDCGELTTIVLPETLTKIHSRAFAGCKNLRGLYLPEGMEVIGSDAFAGCVRLEAIFVSKTVTSIAPGAFDDCASLIFLFYDGSFEQWNEVYRDYINPYTTAICLDGSYYHGAVG